MRLRARGFLLFSFAFSSVLTFTETLEIPLQIKNGKPILQMPPTYASGSEKFEKKTGSLKTLDLEHALDKRSAEFYTQEEEKKQIFNDIDSLEKRTRLGFTGMRGKKEYTVDDYSGKNSRPRLEGFLNKRFFRNFNELFGSKRATLAFHGMRGKKSQGYDNKITDSESYDASPRQEFLINSGLIDDPEETMEFQDDKRPENESVDIEEMAKRTPYAFQGMRGKKENAYDLKRAMRFLGMRGKKETEVWDSDYKRAPQTSFFGMKGKKAQSSGFFGMRGKKASPNTFFGIKGKRDPLGYDLQNFNSLNQVKESESPKNRFRRGITWLNNSKRAKNVFFGIRGKKSTQEIP